MRRRRRRSDTHTSDERLNAEKARVLLALQKTNPGRHRELLERRIQQIETALAFWGSSVGRAACSAGTTMKDMRASLEKLRSDAAAAALIRDLATDVQQRELFTKLADHFSVLANEVERAIANRVVLEPWNPASEAVRREREENWNT